MEKINNKIIQRCSNCGYNNTYLKEEVEKHFPHSREELICEKCGHSLGVNNWIVGR